MIVRDEARVIERLLRSVAEVVDEYVICDTGSVDDTPERITRFMAACGLSGHIHHRPWVNFGHNRDEALQYAVRQSRADYALFIDADEELELAPEHELGSLFADAHLVEKVHGAIRYAVPSLVHLRRKRWRWRAPVHNYLQCLDRPHTEALTRGVSILYHAGEGAKSHGVTPEQKYLRDARLLEEELRRNPGDRRSVFYLAQSYRDAGRPEQALEHYRRRTRMGGWSEERFCAQLECAKLMMRLGGTAGAIRQAVEQACAIRPARAAEALYVLARYYRKRRRYRDGYLYARQALEAERPADRLFVEPAVYRWKLADEVAVCAYWVGELDHAAALNQELLERTDLPPRDRQRIEENLACTERKRAAR